MSSAKVLIAVDSSPFASAVVEAVSKRRWEPGTHIRLISVVEPANAWETTEPLLHQCEAILEQRVKALGKALPKCTVVGELVEGIPPQGILQTADDWDADLIVIGSHGDTGIRRKQIGSVAAAIVNEANCTVEVVKVGSPRKGAQGKPTAKVAAV